MRNILIGEGDIAQQVHTLSNLPGPTSALVQEEKEKSVVNVETLVDKFRQLGSLSGLAYYEAFAYGDASLQDKTTNVYRDLLALHDKYTTTFNSFESTSKDVVHQLQTAFDQLQQGEQEASIGTLRQVSGATTTLKGSASTLHQATETSEVKVKQLLDDAVRLRAQRVEQKRQLQQEMDKLQVDMARIQRERQNAEVAVNQAKGNADQARAEADGARRKAKKKKRGLGGFFNKLLGKVKKYEKREKAARSEQHIHEAKLKEHQNAQKQAEQRQANLESQFKTLNTYFISVDKAIVALRDADNVFQALEVLVRDATTYWDSMQGFAEDMLQTLSSTHDTISSETVNDGGKKIWESPAFEFRGVSLYAKWLALQQQSSYYLENTSEVKAQIASYVSIEQPSPQQAKDMIDKIKSGQIAMPKDEL